MSWKVTSDEFERMIEAAVAELPEEFRDALENVAIVAEEEPSPDDFGPGEPPPGDELLGIFRGTANTNRSFAEPVVEPNLIAIFRGPILRSSSSREEAIDEIRDTVIHELGHYLGLEHDDMPY